MKATISDVAARAGVTKSTVSHALSGKRPVAPETRVRIEAAIAELGYHPNAIARRLAAGHSHAIGLLFPLGQGAVSLFDTPVVSASAATAAVAGYALVLALVPVESDKALRERLNDGLLDGALVLSPAMTDSRVDLLQGAELPFVLIGRTRDNAGLSFVDADVDAAVDACVDHLVALGHNRIAFLRDGAAPARVLQAYELACARRRIRLLTAAAASHAGARDAASRLLREHGELTGIVAWSEWAAWSAYQAAVASGRAVPSELSMVCLGQGVAEEILPFEPTRLDLQLEQLGRVAVSLLLQQLDGRGGDQQVLLQPKLRLGATSAPPSETSKGLA